MESMSVNGGLRPCCDCVIKNRTLFNKRLSIVFAVKRDQGKRTSMPLYSMKKQSDSQPG
ncbi:hypothetical protein [uncultured Vibrio sp.]|uniref:hypothetical protein n=1 Tax=uncultured Vibrio sp. TaxID=114054 RepID=UPI0025E5641A|nr:hypothetical protein [uncultured Vibrio sp.]